MANYMKSMQGFLNVQLASILSVLLFTVARFVVTIVDAIIRVNFKVRAKINCYSKISAHIPHVLHKYDC